MGKVYWSEVAQTDLLRIGDYYVDESPVFALEIVEEILARVRQLEKFPESGRQVPEFDDKTLKEIYHRGYRIVHKVESDGHLTMVAIVHDSRNLPNAARKQGWEPDS